MPTIINNFIKAEEFTILYKVFFSLRFAWYYAPAQAHWDKNYSESDIETRGIFQHGVYVQHQKSYAFDVCIPIIKKLGIKDNQLLRIQANCLLPNNRPYYSDWHTDFPDEKNQPKFSTAVYHLNTNNGATEFKDGTSVQSDKNRIVFFDGTTSHRSKSQTDTKRRIVINFNYLTDA